MNTLYASNTNSKILITCPHCKFGSRYDGSYIEDAIKIRHDIVCVACGEVFNLVVSIPVKETVEHTLAPDAACGHAGSDNWKMDKSGNMYCVLCRAGKA